MNMSVDADDDMQLSQTVSANDTALSYMKRCAATSLVTKIPLIDNTGAGRSGLIGGEGLLFTGPKAGGKSQIAYHIVAAALRESSWSNVHYYDCDKTFDGKRLQQLAGPTAQLENVTVYRPQNMQQLGETLLHTLGKPPKVVIVDGINYLIGTDRGAASPNIPSALQLLRAASVTVLIIVSHTYHTSNTPIQPLFLAKQLLADFSPSLVLQVTPSHRMTSLDVKQDGTNIVTKELQTAAFAISTAGIVLES
eukprot:TRINITY_DN1405_c0_g1_i1.p1 TRINITY_DN1405_c0_g1~~TRINITY_DN1405_c0_g1_i1.p1  ORF type:complete len:251 (+),score=47.11 TRINITY_DN1405_c0_g1_i1:631-1383(+)